MTTTRAIKVSAGLFWELFGSEVEPGEEDPQADAGRRDVCAAWRAAIARVPRARTQGYYTVYLTPAGIASLHESLLYHADRVGDWPSDEGGPQLRAAMLRLRGKLTEEMKP